MVKEIKKEIDESATSPIEVKSRRINKKMLLIIINSVLILGIAGGAGWYFNRSDKHAEKNEKKISKSSLLIEPKFIPLEPFTVNLQREVADQFLQIGITLKILQPELEERIKKNLPEIRSRLLVLLSGKFPSELTSSIGKKKLANEIIAETETVLGLRTTPTLPDSIIPASTKPNAASSVEAASQVEATSSEETADAAEGTPTKPNSEEGDRIVAVLFTSFIIQ